MDTKPPVRCGVLVISDRCYRGETKDESGPAVRELLRTTKHFTAVIELIVCVPDDLDTIRHALTHWSDDLKLDFVISSGGTGFGVRDVTPEATLSVLDRQAHGMMTAVFQQCYPHSILSRGVCGVRKSTLIINFPGSPKACRECFAIIEPKLSHIFDLLRNNLPAIRQSHHETIPHECHHHHEDNPPTNMPTGDSLKIPSGPAFRHRKSPFPAISVSEAQQMVLNEAGSIGLREEITDFVDALGRVLSRDVTAEDPLPPFRASIKDGYAVLSDDGDGERRVLGASHAGCREDENPLASGSCFRITTGAPLPDGADAVVQVEDTELVDHDPNTAEELTIRILKAPKPGQDIRPIGSDIQAGTVIAKAGTVITPAALGVLATCGVTRIPTYSQPAIGLLSTGDELVVPDISPLPPGKIRDSNKTVLMNTLKIHGYTGQDLGIVHDASNELIDAIKNALSSVDVLVLTGGVSMGEKDLVKPIITQNFGGTIHFGRVFMKPGLPTTFATVVYDGKKKLIFGLPGNPVSATVTCNLFVLPGVRKLSGFSNPFYTTVRAEIAQEIRLDPRPEYHRAVLEWSSDKNWPVAYSTGNQISSRLLSVSGADVLLCLPPKSENQQVLPKGEMVDAILL